MECARRAKEAHGLQQAEVHAQRVTQGLQPATGSPSTPRSAHVSATSTAQCTAGTGSRTALARLYSADVLTV